jgi:hypothetical protein
VSPSKVTRSDLALSVWQSAAHLFELIPLSPLQRALLHGASAAAAVLLVARAGRGFYLAGLRQHLSSEHTVSAVVKEKAFLEEGGGGGGGGGGEDGGDTAGLDRRVVAKLLRGGLSEAHLASAALSAVDKKDVAVLRRIVAEEIPTLRRRAAAESASGSAGRRVPVTAIPIANAVADADADLRRSPSPVSLSLPAATSDSLSHSPQTTTELVEEVASPINGLIESDLNG